MVPPDQVRNMHKTTRPFVNSLQSLLQNRLPADEYQQIMEESLWEYQKFMDGPDDGRPLRNEYNARICCICVSFYRAMISVGMERKIAAGAIADASLNLDWSPSPPSASETCTLARYFFGKDALDLCEITLCRKCVRQAECANLAEMKAMKGNPGVTPT